MIDWLTLRFPSFGINLGGLTEFSVVKLVVFSPAPPPLFCIGYYIVGLESVVARNSEESRVEELNCCNS